jgi:hypothetical protein
LLTVGTASNDIITTITTNTNNDIITSYESKLAVSMIQAMAKPCDLIFLVYILIHTLKSDNGDNSMIEENNYRSSFIANELLLEYRAKGYNLHVEPVHIPHPSNTTVQLLLLLILVILILLLLGYKKITIHINTDETCSISI